MTKQFYCGLCSKEKRKAMTRKGIRDHIREEHHIGSEIINFSIGGGDQGTRSWVRQKWIITKEVQ